MSRSAKKKSGFDRFIDGVERVGNKLPHPFWLFVLLSVITIALSAILSLANVQITYTQASFSASGAPAEAVATVNNLLSGEAIGTVLTQFTSIYSGFAPLGIVIIMMLGVGMLEQTGMLSALIRKTLLGTPEALMLLVIAFVGVNANLASDAGVVIVPTVAAAIFKALGMNPWIGIIAGYAAANGGYTANLFISSMDALLASITESVVEGAGIVAPVHPLMNYYFIAAGCIVIVICTELVTKFYTAPKLGVKSLTIDQELAGKHALTKEETRGLRYCGIVSIIYFGVLIALCIPKTSIFRNADGGFLPKSPLLSSVIALLFFFFFALSVAYGLGADIIKSPDDIPRYMQKGVSNALGFIVIALPASIFIHLFHASNLSTVIGALGGKVLNSISLKGFPLLLAFILLCSIINLFVTSGSAKWLIIAPIFVPMFASLGFSPAMTQATYRIADTCSNIISPIDYYVPVIIGMLTMYNDDPDRKVGIGTVMSLCMPYTIAYLIGMVLLLLVWYVFGFDLGPGTPMFLM